MGRTPRFHCHWPAFNLWSSRKPSGVTKEKKNKKELLIVLLFFYSRKTDKGSGM